MRAVLLVEAIRDRRRGRLVDDAQHLEPRDGARVLRGLPLRVVEVRRHCDHRLLDIALVAQVRLRDLLHLCEHHRGHFFRLELLVLALVLHYNLGHVTGARLEAEGPVLCVLLNRLVLELATNEALCIKDLQARASIVSAAVACA